MTTVVLRRCVLRSSDRIIFYHPAVIRINGQIISIHELPIYRGRKRANNSKNWIVWDGARS